MPRTKTNRGEDDGLEERPRIKRYKDGVIPTEKGPRFIKGHKKFGTGRTKGTPNRSTRLLKEAIILAAEAVGQDGKGKDKLVGYLMWLAKTEPSTFGSLLGKLLPLQITGKDDKAIEEHVTHVFEGKDLSKLSVEQLSALYQEAIRTPSDEQQERGHTRH